MIPLREDDRVSITPAHPYDVVTLDHLTWAHGPKRAALILAGDDPETEADIACWRRMGARR